MTQEDFETGVKAAADTLIAANQAWVDALAELCSHAEEAGLDEDRCVVCVAHHVNRLQASIEATQPTSQA